MFENLEKFKLELNAELEAITQCNAQLIAFNQALQERVLQLEKTVYEAKLGNL